MLKIIRYTALLAGVSAVLSPPVLAQVRDLDGERSDVRVYQGRIDGAPAVFEVTVPADSSMLIDVIATGELDPVVRVMDANGELLAEDDDGGEGLNSRVRIAGENGRRITIEVDSYDAEWVEEGETYGGTFDLRLSTSEYVEVATRAVTYGARESGTIVGEPHLFTIEGVAGELVEIALVAQDDVLDPYLELRDADGETLASNDDGGNGLNSLLRHTFAESGTYTIVASGYGESTGEYLLRVRERRDSMVQLPLQVIGIDDEASGELASGWADGESLMLTYIDYQLSEEAKAAIRAGDGAVTIRMNAVDGGDLDFGGSIDPYIELGFETPLGFAVVDSDDDGAGSLNSLLPVDLGRLADQPAMLDALRIRAQGYGGSAGAYTLVITEGMEARAEYDMDAPPIMIPPPAPRPRD
ncbi:hypothetical protein OZN62_13590 [Aurantiacibacter sp. MUD11]|uniref:hypothetical protein n=1 Tax=Aurantiacibacter sp. MUD11 TaxID=3003265 RepID=UPI0022AA9B73|nr:hypothetical protein [Aurantiacibacter sp. MUD11]WAT17929.1 hypothetical protein OZN62_13590 [Aurantiacibacter sp. MUD11]